MSAIAPGHSATAPASGALAGRVVLVAGAHGGLGSAASLACARDGATVVLLGRKVPKLNRLYDALAAEGPEPMLYPLDLEGASPDDYAELATRLEGEFGRPRVPASTTASCPRHGACSPRRWRRRAG